MNINISDIAKGMPGITPVIGNYLYENCVVALHKSGHEDGVDLQVSGLVEDTYQLRWDTQVTEQMLRSYRDDTETTEQGAVCISILTAIRLTDYTVVERSWHGTGIDYWLGYKDDPLFRRTARLEISGIKVETTRNTIIDRYEQKAKQVEQSDVTNLPAYISIVEFGKPKILYDMKT